MPVDIKQRQYEYLNQVCATLGITAGNDDVINFIQTGYLPKRVLDLIKEKGIDPEKPRGCSEEIRGKNLTLCILLENKP